MISTAEGDSFTVDANDRPWSIRAGDRIEVASSTFQAGVFVIGGVDRPGRYEWDDGMTLASAVSLAGGVSADGTQNGWWLRSPGHESRSIRDLETGASVGIAPGDVLVIPRSGPPSDIVVIGAVRQESRMPYRKGMRLKDVLKDSGGVTVDAQRARIEVWATFGGKVRRRVELSAAKGILEDLVLNGGDAVIVREVQVKNAP
jgi:protein involved in polysaccharide export with SLBB domain